jgi:molybdopterin molybdotransferase
MPDPLSSALRTVEEADRLLEEYGADFRAGKSGAEGSVPLAEAAGRVLREPVLADREYPAQDRSRMDGIAIAFSAWAMGVRDFPVTALSRAGDPRIELSDVSGCVEIMTGAACPLGADTIVPYEALSLGNGVARVSETAEIREGQFLHRQGSDCAAGDVLVPEGTRLHAAAVAAAASMGYARLRVAARPRIALVATGDEVVDVRETPLPHQVRGSNAPALEALFTGLGEIEAFRVGDDPEALSARLEACLAACDVLLVTGGVSAGKFDAIPGVLEALGARKVFHKIAQKPGKPLWFGVREAAGKDAQLVFGLPGNPVSALVCARRYALPLLRARAGIRDAAPGARLEGDLKTPVSNFTQFLPARRTFFGTETRVSPLPLNGSGDFSRLALSDGFLEIPPGRNSLTDGEILSFFAWDS